MRWLAKSAFHNMGKSDIMDFMENSGKKLQGGQSLLATLVEAVMKTLAISEAKAMETAKRRVALLKAAQQQVGDFMFLDEVQANLDQADKKEVKNLKEKVKSDNATYSEFVADIKVAKSKPAFGKKAKSDVQAKYKGPRVFASVHETLLQKDFKKFMPPSSYLWVARNEQAWFSRVPPVKAFPRYWRREGGEEPALRLAIQDAWRTWLELEGLDTDACPVLDLFA